MTRILLTGSKGQLGRCVLDRLAKRQDVECHAFDHSALDITDEFKVRQVFAEVQPHFCVNTAAYTNVDKAESEADLAFEVNAKAPGFLASVCKETGTTLIHPSTDYVFDGKKCEPYNESDKTNPINTYGRTKEKGEVAIATEADQFFILRTSWLYSQYGHNFLATVRRVLGGGQPMKIVTTQYGNPTNANDLADAMIELVTSGNREYGIYHYSNAGGGSWFDFAQAIATIDPKLDPSLVGRTDDYRTFAVRPAYSVLDCSKWKERFSSPIRHWRASLEELINHTL